MAKILLFPDLMDWGFLARILENKQIRSKKVRSDTLLFRILRAKLAKNRPKIILRFLALSPQTTI